MLLKIVFSLSLLFLSTSVQAETEDCATPKIYSEIGCTPVLEDGENCPKRFECGTALGRKGNECYYQGKSYSQDIPVAEKTCRASCYCRDGVITCANVECPDLFDYRLRSCVPQHTLNTCCAEDYVCDQKAIEKLGTCYMDGRTYRFGQKMYPESRSCYNCLCAEGFDNTTKPQDNPHCSVIHCGMELHGSDKLRNECTPIYYKNPTCCSLGWRCPDDSDSIVSGEARTNDEDPDMECEFGKLKLKLGDKLNTMQEEKNVDCECSVPPIVTCIKSS